MNTSMSQTQSDSNGGARLSFYVIPVLVILHVLVIFKLFMKHRHHMEPIHIYEFNILTDMTVWFSTFFLGNFESNFKDWAPYCVLVNFIDTSARISGYADISVSQVDRFLALYWNSEYKERVTTSSAITTTAIVKILVMVCTLLIYSVDPDILKCAPDTLPICAYIRKNNFYWVTLPMCSSYLVVLIVTVYVIKIIIKQENIVVPANLQVRGETGDELYKEERVFTITRKNQNILPRQSSSQGHEDQEMKAYETNRNTKIMKSCVVKESQKGKIRRDETNPHMFYRNTEQEQTVPPPPCHPVPRISLNKTARRILSVNLQTLCLLLFVTPLNILNVYIFITEDSCDKNQALSFIGKICTIVAVIYGIFYLYIAWIKLKRVV